MVKGYDYSQRSPTAPQLDLIVSILCMTTKTLHRTSLLADLIGDLPQLHPQLYFKSSLVALSHAMEDQVLAGQGRPIVFANFQKERYYRQEARRYHRISAVADAVYVLAAPETDFTRESVPYETVALDPEDPLAQEWHLIVLDDSYATCLVCRERFLQKPNRASAWANRDTDAARQFEGVWSFERQVVITAARHLIPKITSYRPDLEEALASLGDRLQMDPVPQNRNQSTLYFNPAPFAERLITYLQAGQYKLQRTYKAIQLQERKERLVNRISSAIRRSLDPNDILNIAVRELGQVAQVSRCLVYRCTSDQAEVTIEQEYVQPGQPSLKGHPWPLRTNSFLLDAIHQGETAICHDLHEDPRFIPVASQWQQAQIQAWLVVPLLYQGRVVGVLELHDQEPRAWETPIVELAEAIALQAGVALIQAEAYQHLDDLNHQLAALDQAKTDLIAVTGHELRTPLSTIQICLESLASDPDMPSEMRQEMLSTALQDAGRLRRLVQDFLTLSKLESGRIQWHIEPLSPVECVELALSGVKARRRQVALPEVSLDIPSALPMVLADGEWLVEVLRKLLDNACKFTDPSGHIWIRLLALNRCDVSSMQGSVEGSVLGLPQNDRCTERMIQFTVADSGRGIESDRLTLIFDRFYQAEGSMRRSVSGTGLGLAISRLIVQSMGGCIWAESAGLDQGSAFHFTLPVARTFGGEADHSERIG